jgi:hypothetical protein
MDAERRQLKQEVREELAATTHSTQQAGVREFATVEALLQHDAAQNLPPPSLALRVAESVRREPAQPASFWSKWFSRRHPE